MVHTSIEFAYARREKTEKKQAEEGQGRGREMERCLSIYSEAKAYAVRAVN